MLVSGFLLFSSEAIKCYENPPFFFKMAMLAASLLIQFFVVRPIVQPGREPRRPRAAAIGVVSILSWFLVAAGGRAIGFY